MKIDMSTTLRFDSFAQSNLRERTELAADVAAGASSVVVRSTDGFTVGDVFYIGQLGQDGCERAVVSAVASPTTLTLVSPLERPHAAFSAATAVLGDRIRIYRAPNADGTEPLVDAFSVHATRSIDADQVNTFYTDSSGSADYWYRHTYFNETTLDETELSEFDAVRGDDYAPYALNDEIRKEAGFEGAVNLKDSVVDQQRRAAEAEVNTSLGGYYTVPFTKPVPQTVKYIVIKLAAGFLVANAYGRDASKEGRVKDARAQINAIQTGDLVLDGDAALEAGEGVSGWPDSTTEEPRMFSVEDTY